MRAEHSSTGPLGVLAGSRRERGRVLDLGAQRGDDRLRARRVHGEVLPVGGLGDRGGDLLLDGGVEGYRLQSQLLVQVRSRDRPAQRLASVLR